MKKPEQIEKHFPADTTKEKLTFLNNPKIDAELYAYLMAKSFPDPITKETRTYKKDLPSQTVIATEILRYKSRNSVNNHLKALKEAEYLEDHGTYYTFPKKETIFFPINLGVLDFLRDVVKEPVLKTYIYLGQRFKYKPNEYVFTNKEIAEHIGISYSNNSKTITNYLIALEKFGLIKIAYFYEGKTPQMRLIGFSCEVPELTA